MGTSAPGFYSADCCFALIISAEAGHKNQLKRAKERILAAVVHKSGKEAFISFEKKQTHWR